MGINGLGSGMVVYERLRYIGMVEEEHVRLNITISICDAYIVTQVEELSNAIKAKKGTR